MTERELLEQDIKALRDLLRVAWHDLATKSHTIFERRELRNEMNDRAAELRQHLQALEAELDRERQNAAARYTRVDTRPVNLRLLSRPD